MDLLNLIKNYSGIFALLIYLIILIVIISINKRRNKKSITINSKEYKTLDLNDENAVVASLIAAIECRNEYHKNVKVVSVREVA